MASEDFSITDLLQKSQQNGTKRGLGEATSGKNRIQIHYVEKSDSAAAVAAAQTNMKPMPFIKFVPASSNAALAKPSPPPVAVVVVEKEKKKARMLSEDDDDEEEKVVKTSKKNRKQRVLSEDEEEEEEKPTKKAVEEEHALLKIVQVPAKEDLFESLSAHLKTHSVVNIWGQCKRATLRVSEEKEVKVKNPAFVLELSGSVAELALELSSKHDGSRIHGRPTKLVAGAMGLHVLFADGNTVDIPSHAEALELLLKESHGANVVSAWGEIESAKLVSSNNNGDNNKVEVKNAQFISFSCKDNAAVLVSQDGKRMRGTLSACKADKKGLKVLLEKKQ